MTKEWCNAILQLFPQQRAHHHAQSAKVKANRSITENCALTDCTNLERNADAKLRSERESCQSAHNIAIHPLSTNMSLCSTWPTISASYAYFSNSYHIHLTHNFIRVVIITCLILLISLLYSRVNKTIRAYY